MVLLHSQYYSTFTDQFINYTDQGSIKLFLSNVCIENTNLSGSTSNCSVNLLFNLLGLSCFAYIELGSIRFTGYQLYSDTSPSGECSLDCAYDGLLWIQTLILQYIQRSGKNSNKNWIELTMTQTHRRWITRRQTVSRCNWIRRRLKLFALVREPNCEEGISWTNIDL